METKLSDFFKNRDYYKKDDYLKGLSNPEQITIKLFNSGCLEGLNRTNKGESFYDWTDYYSIQNDSDEFGIIKCIYNRNYLNRCVCCIVLPMQQRKLLFEGSKPIFEDLETKKKSIYDLVRKTFIVSDLECDSIKQFYGGYLIEKNNQKGVSYFNANGKKINIIPQIYSKIRDYHFEEHIEGRLGKSSGRICIVSKDGLEGAYCFVPVPTHFTAPNKKNSDYYGFTKVTIKKFYIAPIFEKLSIFENYGYPAENMFNYEMYNNVSENMEDDDQSCQEFSSEVCYSKYAAKMLFSCRINGKWGLYSRMNKSFEVEPIFDKPLVEFNEIKNTFFGLIAGKIYGIHNSKLFLVEFVDKIDANLNDTQKLLLDDGKPYRERSFLLRD